MIYAGARYTPGGVPRPPLLSFLDSAGVIVNNAPAFRKTLPHQGKNSPDIALRPGKMPMSKHQSGIIAEKMKFQA